MGLQRRAIITIGDTSLSRNTYNLSHQIHVSGQIGRIQTLSVIPVIAGDSLKISLDGVIRLAPTRKEIVSECQVDICAFYVKYRHVYGDQVWKQFLAAGPQENNPFVGIPVAANYRNPFYLGIKECGATVNTALLRAYNFIMARYFFVPNSNTNGEMNATVNDNLSLLDWYPTNEAFAENMRRYGAMAARLPHILNGANLMNVQGAGGNFSQLTDNDWGVMINDTSPDVGLLDIRDLAAIQGRYKTVQQKNYWAQFYTDILEQRFNTSGVNTDADKRPDYLGRATQFLSGTDVNGTDDATLGSYVGKTIDRINFNMPRRVFPEHGTVHVMAVLRYPLVHTKEQHPLLANPTPHANLLIGDPELWANEQPVAFDPGNWMAGGSTYTPDVLTAAQPYGQEYRYQPNRIHPNFETIPGYPFTQWDTSTPSKWYYYFNDEYKDTFQTSQIGHWQAHMSAKVTKYSLIPGGASSIMAGT